MNRKAFFYGIIYIGFMGLIVGLKLDRSLVIYLGVTIVGYYISLILGISNKISVKVLFYLLNLILFPVGLPLMDYFLGASLFSIDATKYTKWIIFAQYISIFIYTYTLTAEVLLNHLKLLKLNRTFIGTFIYTLLISIYSGVGNYIYLLSKRTGFRTKTELLQLINLAREYFQDNLLNIGVFSAIQFLILSMYIVFTIENRREK